MAVTDLTNTKWLINSVPEKPSTDLYFNINFSSNNNNYTQLQLHYRSVIWNDEGIVYDGLAVYGANYGWLEGEAYRTIEITGGTDVTHTDLITWLQENATQITTGGSMYLGTSTISKMYLGQAEVSKVYLGQDLVYEKQAPTPSAVQVTLTASGRWNYQSVGAIYICEGQDSSGQVLLNQTTANKSAYPINVNVSGGYMYIEVNGLNMMGVLVTSNDYTVTPIRITSYQCTYVVSGINANGTVNIEVDDFDD